MGRRVVPNFETLKPDRLSQYARDVTENDLRSSLFYLQSYPGLVSATAYLPDTEDGARAAAVLAYGWMPTIPKHVDARRLRDLRTQAKSEAYESMDVGEVSPVNNSWVGLSKILHFTAPDRFPIWDSKIAALFRLTSHQQVNRRDHYAEYCKHMRQAVPGANLSPMVDLVHKLSNVKIGPMRAGELALFAMSSNGKA